MENKVFVYGTLKQGLGNHRIIKKYVRSSQNAIMRGWMFNLDFYPGVVLGNGIVHGQLLELDMPEKAFSAMDILEGYQEPEHPRNLYERVKTTVTLENGEMVECFVYIMHERNKAELSKNATLMQSGMWDVAARKMQLYFAYGSCMSEASFSETVKSFSRIGMAELKGYRVGFTKYSSKWGGGVADLLSVPGETMEGVLYLIPEAEAESLDVREGANLNPPMYRRVGVTITVDGMQLPAFTYEVVAKSEQEISPSDDYMNTILDGTDILSEDYVERLKKYMALLHKSKSNY